MKDWYLIVDGQEKGPVPSSDLKQLAAQKRITPTTKVRLGSDGDWVPASKVKGLFPESSVQVLNQIHVAAPPPPPPTPPPAPIQFSQPQPQPIIHQTIVHNAQHPKWNPGVAGVLSFFMPGLGQLYKGQLLNGLMWFLLVIVGYVALVVPGLVLHFFCVWGAMRGDPYK